MQNRLSVTVEKIKSLDDKNMLLSLSIEDQIIQALVTCQAVEMLGITVGKSVFVL
ncbi:MAG: TOBE domain-containing protein [Endozoicomonas sp.]